MERFFDSLNALEVPIVASIANYHQFPLWSIASRSLEPTGIPFTFMAYTLAGHLDFNNIWILTVSLLAIVLVLKNIIRRDRPFLNFPEDHIIFDTYGSVDSLARKLNVSPTHSFPSGHAFTSYFLFRTSKQRLLSRSILLFWVFFVCMSRIALSVHHPSDVIFGILMAEIVVKASQQSRNLT